MLNVTVSACWDNEAKVWVATSDDVPGLIAEAGNKEELVKKLQSLIPELLELNGCLNQDHGDVPVELLMKDKFLAPMVA